MFYCHSPLVWHYLLEISPRNILFVTVVYLVMPASDMEIVGYLEVQRSGKVLRAQVVSPEADDDEESIREDESLDTDIAVDEIVPLMTSQPPIINLTPTIGASETEFSSNRVFFSIHMLPYHSFLCDFASSLHVICIRLTNLVLFILHT